MQIARSATYNASVGATGWRRNTPSALQFAASSPLLVNVYKVVPASLSDKLVGFFSTIATVWMAAVMAQDAIAIWMPRLYVAFTRDRIPYQPRPYRADMPQAEHPLIAAKNWLKETVVGLNWPNAIEESWREFFTGPGEVIMPSLVLGAAWGLRLIRSRSAVRMDAPTLMGFKNLLKTQLAKQLPEATTESYRQVYHTFLKNLFQFDDVLKPELLKPLAAEINAPALSLEQRLSHWASTLVDATFAETAELKTKLAQAETQVIEGLKHFNRQPVPMAFLQERFGPTAMYQPADIPMTHLNGQRLDVEAATANAKRFGDFLKQLLVRHQAEPTVPLIEELLENGVYKETFNQKAFLISMLGNAVGSLYLWKLMGWAQSGKTYPGNRLMRLTDERSVSA